MNSVYIYIYICNSHDKSSLTYLKTNFAYFCGNHLVWEYSNTYREVLVDSNTNVTQIKDECLATNVSPRRHQDSYELWSILMVNNH